MPLSQSGLVFLPYEVQASVLPAAETARRKIFARCPSLDSLVYEMRRYMKDEVGGRSCLIAGPRGSGKTTMIKMAWDEVKEEFENGCHLILVRLHGPSLLEKTDSSSDAKLYEHVLQTLVINLYQTAAEEMARLFRERVGGTEEMAELAAQLRLALDGAPSAAVLRSFWSKADALPGGILFSRGRGGDARSRMDQGAAEIVALATAAEAYRQCIGKLTKQQKIADVAASKRELTAVVSIAGKEFSQLLMSALSGLAVGAAAWASSMGIIGSAVAGVVTAIASMATLSYSRTVTRESTSKEEITFLPDTEVSALVHRLPLLLMRFRQAGLAPIFFVDELDKVKQLSRSLNALAGYLKFLFADQAFFCFLTDRAYLVETARINRERTNALQRTIFTNQLFVHYGSPSMFKFLKDVIQISGSYDGIEADAQAIRYALMHRSRMLFSELFVEIASMTGPDGVLQVHPGEARSLLVHRFHFLVQLAAECVFINQLVSSRVNRDPEFAQTIYDALFYPTNVWFAGGKEVECKVDSLVEGMSALADAPLELTDGDKEFLRAQVQYHLELVADPDRLERQLRDHVNHGRIHLDELVLQAIGGISPLKRIDDDKYEWTYNWYGIPHNAGDVTDILNNAQLQNAQEWIVELQRVLTQIPGTLSVDQVRVTTKSALELLELFVPGTAVPEGTNEESVLQVGLNRSYISRT